MTGWRCSPELLLLLVSRLLGAARGVSLELLYPANGSCMVASRVPVRTEVVLDANETIDGFLQEHGERQICLSITEADDGGRSVVPHGGGEGVTCFALDSPSMFLPEVGSGCRRLVARLSGSEVTSPPAMFEVVERVGAVCASLGRCTAGQGGHKKLQLTIDSPRSGDVVWGDSVHVVVYASLASNGTRVRAPGRLCLTYQQHHHTNQVERCVEVVESTYSEGISVTVEVAAGGPGVMALSATLVTIEGERLDAKSPVAFTFERVVPETTTLQDVVLPASLLQSEPSLLPALPTVLLLSHYHEDLSWLTRQPYPAIIYEKKPPLSMQDLHGVPHNVAGEATAYLKFIVDYYHHLPVTTIFLHSHRSAYHQEDMLLVLPLMQAHAGEQAQYCNLNRVVWGMKEDPDRSFLRQQWHEWLGRWLGHDMPTDLLDRCCAQFRVHRDRIRRWPRQFYQEALRRMYFGGSVSREESRRYGLLMEWLWHYLFGEPAMAHEELRPLLPLLPDADRLALTSRPPCLRPAT